MCKPETVYVLHACRHERYSGEAYSQVFGVTTTLQEAEKLRHKLNAEGVYGWAEITERTLDKED